MADKQYKVVVFEITPGDPTDVLPRRREKALDMDVRAHDPWCAVLSAAEQITQQEDEGITSESETQAILSDPETMDAIREGREECP